MPLYDVDNSPVINHWIEFFRANPTLNKCYVYSRATVGTSKEMDISEEPPLKVISQLTEKIDLFKIPYPISLLTYLGFSFHPIGLIFRSLVDKEFHHCVNETPSFYVSKAFEDNQRKFKFGQPIVLTEGVLDAEAFVAITGYPYVVAYLTSSVPSLLAYFLSVLTKDAIIVPDTDFWGLKNLEITKRNLERGDIHFNLVKLPRSDIDVYDFYRDGSEMDKSIFKQRVATLI